MPTLFSELGDEKRARYRGSDSPGNFSPNLSTNSLDNKDFFINSSNIDYILTLPAGGVGDDGRDDVEVGAAERVDHRGHAPVQQVASHVEHLGKEVEDID